jgi:eukaryotic-like serine/threonine-protein kinase
MRMAHDPSSWRQVKALLAQVLEEPPEQRRALAEQLSGDDAAMREELLSLLAATENDATLQALPAELALQALQAHMDQPRWAGRRAGPWRIVSLIARGGMGEVYRAERADGQFEQQVALKLLRSGFDQEWLVSRFAAERRILASLDHPNLARVLDGGTTDEGIPYFVMELVDGQPIDRYAQGLPVQERLALFRTVCQVVAYAHSKGVVHRDLKTDNILVTAEGVLKLVDFGIAKQLVADAQNTATAQRMMTLAYSSPEQVRGAEVTPASDVYSLGVVLYRLLTQTSPYGSVNADSGYELTRAICDTEPPPPSRATTTAPALSRAQRRRLRGDLDAVVMMALRKDPAKRYANAAELGDDVFRHMESLPVRARRGAWSYRVNRFVLRHRVVFGAAMLANIALFVGLGVAVHQSIEADRQRERAERNLATVREFANVLIFDVHLAILNVPGATKARKLLVDKAVDYLQRVSVDLPDDASVRFDVANAYRKLADIQGKPFAANLGDPNGAVQSYEKARTMYEQIIQSGLSVEPTMRRVQLELMDVLGILSILQRGLGHKAEALSLLEQARSTGEAVLAKGAADSKFSLQLGKLYTDLAHAHADDADPQPALAWYDAAEAMFAPLTDLPDLGTNATRLLAAVNAQRGMIHHGRSDDGDEAQLALKYYDRARLGFEKVLKLKPENVTAIRDIATLDTMAGQLLLTLHRPQEATAALKRAWAAATTLAAKDPANFDAKLEAARSASLYGDALCANGDPAGMAHIDAAITIYEQADRDGRLIEDRRYSLAKFYDAKARALGRSATEQARAAKESIQAQACLFFDKAVAVLARLDAATQPVMQLKSELEAEMKSCRTPGRPSTY